MLLHGTHYEPANDKSSVSTLQKHYHGCYNVFSQLRSDVKILGLLSDELQYDEDPDPNNSNNFMCESIHLCQLITPKP